MIEAHDNEAIFRAVCAAMERQDVDGEVEFFADDVALVDYTDPTVVHSGRAAIAELIRSFFEPLSQVKIAVTDLVANGDRLAAELLVRATPRRRIEPIGMHYCVFVVFQGGKIHSIHEYVDSRQVPGAP